MSNCPEHNPLQREGLSQFQRALAALMPDYVRVDERTITDLLTLAAAYAQKAKPLFYQLDNQTTALPSEWETLMNYERQFRNPSDVLGEMKRRQDFSPHFALFLCFLKLFEHLQEDINQLTQKHLDFYYKEVLQLANRQPVADSVHVLFTLAQNASEQIVEVNTPLDAGRDASKPTPLPLTYQTQENLTMNRATIASVRSVFLNPATQKLLFAPDAKTADGIKKPLPADNPSWSAFGPKLTLPVNCPSCDGSTNVTASPLPEAQVGFAFASPVLQLAEGTRTITVDMGVVGSIPTLPNNLFLAVQLSGAKSWIEAGQVALTATTTGLQLVVTVSADEKEGVINFNPDKLDGNYQTTAPVMRCWLADSSHYALLRNLSISTVKISAQVTGLKKSLVLENDLGKVSPEKSFMPFGAQPVVGSTLYVTCPEAQQKTLQSVSVRVEEWVGKPGNLTTHYQNYKTYTLNSSDNPVVKANYAKQEADFKATVSVINGNLSGLQATGKTLFSDFVAAAGVVVQPATFTLVTGGLLGFSYLGGYVRTGNIFSNFILGFTGIRHLLAAPATVSDSLLKIRLTTDFLHNLFPTILTEVVSFNGVFQKNQPVPNPPYTPVTAGLVMNYAASSQTVILTDTDFNNFSRRDVQFFHLGVFGQAEEHAFLKSEQRFLSATERATAYLLPQYVDQGTFYLGLQDIGPLEIIRLLIQVAEGSANPERPPATVRWSVLVNNQWRLFTDEQVLSDDTNQLLKSGIIQFYLPTETTDTNTLLDSGLVWLKAELWLNDTPAPIDSVCNLIDLHSQAVLATFQDDGNDPAHYNQPLPAQTISKARIGLGAIKKTEQPYASFGGKPQEAAPAFYQRVSERLRHKQRAVSIWDYEHLILQEFPAVFKARCLNHTKLDKLKPQADPDRFDQLAPGYVTVVVVPDLHNQNAINRLEPKVDLDTLQRIREYLQKHAGKLVTLATTNPEYEPVRLKFKVRFRRGYAFSTYKKKLNEALIKYLSPWVSGDPADISFGGILEKSVIINFVERLEYVDVLSDFVMLRIGDPYEGYEEIMAANPMAVLVSCQEHCISDFTDC